MAKWLYLVPYSVVQLRFDCTKKDLSFEAVLQEMAGVKRVTIVTIKKGGLMSILSYSPLETDGMWSHEIVREFLEESNNDEIENGIILGRRNQRGVYNCTGGKEERRIGR